MTTLIIQVDDRTQAAGGYPVRARVVDVVATASGRPVASGEIPQRLLESPPHGLDPRRFILDGGTGPDDMVGVIGEWLASLVASCEPVRHLGGHPGANGAGGPRLVLDVRPPELRSLPWELLKCGQQCLFIHQHIPCVRGDVDRVNVAKDIRVPLRMMAVVADSTARDLRSEAEISAIQVGLHKLHGKLHPEVLSDPSRADLFRDLSLIRPHILHIIGHGELRPRDGKPQIAFRNWSLTTDDLANGLGPVVPRLVVLNVCRTGDLAQRSAWGFVDAFVDKGVLGVLAMQADMLSDAAVCFAQRFYAEIAAGQPVDLAANRGRYDVWARHGPERCDWAMPTLTVCAPPNRILPVRCDAQDQDVEAVRRTKAHRRIESFVDRHRQRRMWLSIDPDERADPARVLLVTGAAGTGKTDLVYSCLLTSFLRGRSLTYVDLDRTAMDWLDVLRRIRQGGSDLPIAPRLDDLDGTAFTAWKHDINHLARGLWPPPQKVKVEHPDDQMARWAPRSEEADAQIELAFELFREGLSRLGRDRPFIAALDHVDGVGPSDFSRHLWPKLIQPVANGDVGHVRMIVVLRSEQRDELVPADADLTYVEEFDVPAFERDDFPRLAREYFARHGRLPDSEEDAWFSTTAKTLAPTWTPKKEFAKLQSYLREAAK